MADVMYNSITRKVLLNSDNDRLLLDDTGGGGGSYPTNGLISHWTFASDTVTDYEVIDEIGGYRAQMNASGSTFTADHNATANAAIVGDSANILSVRGAGNQAGLPLGSTDRTWCLWIYGVGIQANDTFYSYGASTNYKGWYMAYQTAGLEMGFYGATTIQTSFKPTGATWYHMTATYDGTDVVIYKDNQQIATAARALDTELGALMRLVGNSFFNGHLQGNMSQLLVYNRVLSESERQDVIDNT